MVDTYTELMSSRIVGLSNSVDGDYTNFMNGLKNNGLISEIAFSFLKNPVTVINNLG